ncbi:NADPH2:quinone reductase [Sphingobium sp. AP50]|uniref:zinc-binding dehydrogenase n=1 Tax=Sphingobium sp. AP50 TaxID=1884369 RepID=UPI0008AFC95F|nr:zinc-binding dehydrogenase [Sphingobium sp. AP50]SEJ81344.1 NADPH2:quinone reductase [Sphingobium sp. AP50]
MAKIIEISANGGPSVLEVKEAGVGAPGHGEVGLIQEAIGINYVDVLVRKGLYPLALPAIPGFEGAGTVDTVGSEVTGFAPGDRVAYFFAKGAYATATLVPANTLVRLPDDISSEVAATFLAKGLTAWMGLRALHQVSAGDKILVLGASGSVGSILSRWAKSLGATVIGVAGSAGKLSKVQAGATHALLAGDPDISATIHQIAPAGVDVVYDFVGQATFALATAAVRDGGVIATIGAVTGQPAPEDSDLVQRGVQVRGGGMPQYVRGDTVEQATNELWDAIRKGLFADLDTVRFAFEDIAKAHEEMDARRLSGLPVLIT